MSTGVAKIAVSMPKDLFRSVEEYRRKRRLPRSAAVVEKLIRQYTEGYRKRPESRLEVREGSRHAAREFRKDPWGLFLP